MAKRTDYSTLHNIPLMLREATEADRATSNAKPGSDIVLCRANDRSTVLAFCDRDDLFDRFGNRFADN